MCEFYIRIDNDSQVSYIMKSTGTTSKDHPTTTSQGSQTTTPKDDSTNTTVIVVVVLVVITLIIIIAAIVYTLYVKGYLGGKDGLQRIRSIVNPAYGNLAEDGDSVSTETVKHFTGHLIILII